MNTKKKKAQKYEQTHETPTILEEPFIKYAALNLDESKRYTYADYLTWFDDIRRELIDGFIHLMSAPVRIHQGVSGKINFILSLFVKKRKGKCKIYYAPFDVRLPKDNVIDDDKIYDVVQPDICVICDLSKLDDKGCIGAPDLIVEILSPSTTKHDCKTKFNLYEKFGVREYWIVDPHQKTVLIFLLQPNEKYDAGAKYEHHQKAPVHIFEGLVIDLKELFSEE
jgi:Uma2 family endonuclease